MKEYFPIIIQSNKLLNYFLYWQKFCFSQLSSKWINLDCRVHSFTGNWSYIYPDTLFYTYLRLKKVEAVVDV